MTLVTFLSDFGTRDIFVGVCHGVIATRAPDARVIDLSHEVPPQDVRTGALMLARAVPHVPADVHLAVVDPGVGTARAAVAVETARGQVLVGPDNGLLTPAADALGGAERIHLLEAAAYRSEEVSATFHGRDVFAPAAGAVASGVPIEELGARRSSLLPLELPTATVDDATILAEVVLVDRFGNLQLAASPDDAVAAGLVVGDRVEVAAAGRHHDAEYVMTFGELPDGDLGLIEDSDGALALVVAGGSARDRLGSGLRSHVRLWGATTAAG
ncbi:MAG: SAM-dependent chlorinase/fluorinase [Nitriliruptorales bacterium]|nr:SAM-dependent chlorinase/fluorinase [Nitriliruptorales bacterium]